MFNLGMGNGMFDSIFGDEFQMELTAVTEQKAAKTAKAETTKKSSGSTKKEPAKKKEKTMKVTLPCTVYGSAFKVIIAPTDGETEIVDSDQLVKKLQEAGIDEAVTSYRKIYVPEENASVAYLVDDASLKTDVNVLAQLEDGVTFAYGEKKISLTLDMFEGMDADDIALSNLIEKIVEAFPQFKDVSFGYDVEAGVITVLLNDGKLTDKDKLTLPIMVSINGEEVTVGEEDVSGSTVKDVVAFLSARYACPEVDTYLYKRGDYFFGKLVSSKAIGNNVEKKNKGAKTKMKEEKYPSNCTVVLVFYNHTEKMSAEMFGGKDKITKKDVIEYFKPKYSYFQQEGKSKQMNFYYDKLQNILSVERNAGARGAVSTALRYNAAWNFEEREVFKNSTGSDLMERAIFSNDELEKVLHDSSVTAYFRPVYCRGEYYDGMVHASRSTAYVYRSTDKGNELLSANLKVEKIPKSVYDAILAYFKSKMPNEAICRIVYDHCTKEYSVQLPVTADETRISVSNIRFNPIVSLSKEVIMTIHSHNAMPAFFSSTDDEAELSSIGVYGVIGKLDREPEMVLRAVYEGGVKTMAFSDLFE